MFYNIGGKLKRLAQVGWWFGLILSALLGLLVVLNDKSIFLGVLILFFCSLFSWVGSFVIYGFGELIDTARDIKHNFTKLGEVNDDIDIYAHPNWHHTYNKNK